MPRWFAALAGFNGDLRAAVHCFAIPEASMFEHPEFGTSIRSTDFANCATGADVEKAGERLLAAVSSAMRAAADNSRPIYLWTVHNEDHVGYHICGPSRDRWHRQSDRDDRTFSDLWLGAAGRTGTVQAIFHAGRRNLAVARGLDLWSAERHGVSIYKIFELIRADVGDGIRRFASKSDLNRFTGSVNRPEVLGDFARHEVMPGDPPRNPMQRAEAEAFIQGLLVRWALSKP